MENLYEKVAYLKGLSEGYKLEKSSKEGKLINEIIELMDSVLDEIKDIKFGNEYVESYLEVLDEDLDRVEERLNELDDFDFEDDYEDFDDLDDEYMLLEDYGEFIVPKEDNTEVEE